MIIIIDTDAHNVSSKTDFGLLCFYRQRGISEETTLSAFSFFNVSLHLWTHFDLEINNTTLTSQLHVNGIPQNSVNITV